MSAEDLTEEGESVFDLLPDAITESIIGLLPLKFVGQSIPLVSKHFLELSNRVIRRKFLQLSEMIIEELTRLRLENENTPKNVETIPKRSDILRSHFTLELLLEEMNLLKSLFRHFILHSDTFYSFGVLTGEYYNVYYTAKQLNLPPWQFNDPLTTSMLNITKKLIDRKMNREIESENYRLGSYVVDVMESIINKKYSFSICMSPETNSCSFTGVYKLRNPQYLNRPPRWANDGSPTPSKDDIKRFMNFLINKVRINNRVLLREEQHYRELESLSRVDFGIRQFQNGIPNFGTRYLDKELRVYNDLPHYVAREIVEVDNIVQIKEQYTSRDYVVDDLLNRGFKCEIQLSCSLSDAPWLIRDCWQRMMKQISTDEYTHDETEKVLIEKIKALRAESFEAETSSYLESDIESQPSVHESASHTIYSFQSSVEVVLQSITSEFEVEVYLLQMEDP